MSSSRNGNSGNKSLRNASKQIVHRSSLRNPKPHKLGGTPPSPYKTRQRRNGSSSEKARYSPEVCSPRRQRSSQNGHAPISPLRSLRKRRISVEDQTSSHSPLKRKKTDDIANGDIMNVSHLCDVKPQNTKEMSCEEMCISVSNEKSMLHAALNDRDAPLSQDNDLEQQFKKALRLYRYMSLPDVQNGTMKRPIYRPFLIRNLSYVKSATQSTSGEKGSKQLRQHAEKSNAKMFVIRQTNLMNVVDAIHRRGDPSNALVKSKPKGKCVRKNGRFLRKMQPQSKVPSTSEIKVENDNREHYNCFHISSMIRFHDVRNKELPGNRHAVITVYLCTETDGVFSEIIRLPSATVQLQINARCDPVAIDLPPSVGCPLYCKGKERNDYVIIRVTFSREQDARVLGGRTFRSVPSRQNDKNTRRNNKVEKNHLDDGITMLGARCVSNISKKKPGSNGLIYGNGSITLIPETLLNTNDDWRCDGTLAKKLVDLGKKLHMSPFVRMSIVQDSSGETSSSDDDESKSCSSHLTCTSTAKNHQFRHASVSSVKDSVHSATSEHTIAKNDIEFEQYMKNRFKHELSLKFPKKICYRFIVKYDVETSGNTCKNEDFPSFKSEAILVKNESHGIMTEDSKGSRRHNSPLKEVSPSKVPNGCLSLKSVTSANQNSKSTNGTDPASTKYRLEVPRRDMPLPEVVDDLASKFQECSKISPPKSIPIDDKVTVPELHYMGYPQPDQNGIVTRFISPSNRCFFCLKTFPNMFALLLHMRTSYPRLDIMYRGDARETAVINNCAPVFIDVFVRQNFDSSYEGPMIRQYMCARSRVMPQRCIFNNRLTFLVHKAEARSVRKMPKDLSIFFTQSERERRCLKGHNAAYFGFRSRHPLVNCYQGSTKQTDQEWLREFIIRQIDDFLDLSRGEKDFMSLWSIFLLNLNHKPFGRCHTYRTCRLFLRKHLNDLLRKNLQNAWVFHLTALFEKEALDSDEVYDLTMRLRKNYDPANDIKHVVYATRARSEVASGSSKKEPPAWQREPIHGPKISILRSSSFARMSSVETNSDNEDLFKKFTNDTGLKQRRSSSCSVDEPIRQGNNRRQREPDCSKYLSSPQPTQQAKWLSFAD